MHQDATEFGLVEEQNWTRRSLLVHFKHLWVVVLDENFRHHKTQDTTKRNPVNKQIESNTLHYRTGQCDSKATAAATEETRGCSSSSSNSTSRELSKSDSCNQFARVCCLSQDDHATIQPLFGFPGPQSKRPKFHRPPSHPMCLCASEFMHSSETSWKDIMQPLARHRCSLRHFLRWRNRWHSARADEAHQHRQCHPCGHLLEWRSLRALSLSCAQHAGLPCNLALSIVSLSRATNSLHAQKRMRSQESQADRSHVHKILRAARVKGTPCLFRVEPWIAPCGSVGMSRGARISQRRIHHRRQSGMA